MRIRRGGRSMLAALVFEPRCDHSEEDKACAQEFFHLTSVGGPSSKQVTK